MTQMTRICADFSRFRIDRNFKYLFSGKASQLYKGKIRVNPRHPCHPRCHYFYVARKRPTRPRTFLQKNKNHLKEFAENNSDISTFGRS